MKIDDRKRIIENNFRLNLIYNKYKMLSLNMFRWEGLPETIESRHIENSLFNYGLCLIINKKDIAYIFVSFYYNIYIKIINGRTKLKTG